VDIAGTDLLPGEGVATGTVMDLRGVLIPIDHLQRREALTRIGQRDRYRAAIKVKDRNEYRVSRLGRTMGA
jgi:hypothetical protein